MNDGTKYYPLGEGFERSVQGERLVATSRLERVLKYAVYENFGTQSNIALQAIELKNYLAIAGCISKQSSICR